MIWLYRLAFLPLLLLALPYYLLRMFRRGGYSEGFSHRFGRIAAPPKPPGVKRIWIQAVSVGEIGAVEPLLRALKTRRDIEVVLTTTTSTGYKIARDKIAPLTAATGIFPLDFWLFNRAAWRRIRPDLVVLMEGELWPEHLHRARVTGTPVALINARLSDRSFSRYSRVRALAERLLGRIDAVLAGTPSDLERLLALGSRQESTACAGNLKCDVDVGAPVTEAERRELFAELFGETPAPGERPPVLLGSSTWPGEEAMLMKTYEEARQAGIPLRLLLVPRHAERRAEVASLPSAVGARHYLRSQFIPAPFPADVVVADTTGELRRLSRAADLAFVGKSLPPNAGGQTPIECAMLAIPQVFGPAMSNFRDISRDLADCGAARRVRDADEARRTLLSLLQDKPARALMSVKAADWSRTNQGATRRVMEALLGLLSGPARRR